MATHSGENEYEKLQGHRHSRASAGVNASPPGLSIIKHYKFASTRNMHHFRFLRIRGPRLSLLASVLFRTHGSPHMHLSSCPLLHIVLLRHLDIEERFEFPMFRCLTESTAHALVKRY